MFPLRAEKDGDDCSDVDSESEEQRLLFEALRSRRAKEQETTKAAEATEFPTFIADEDHEDVDDDDDDDVQVTTSGERFSLSFPWGTGIETCKIKMRL